MTSCCGWKMQNCTFRSFVKLDTYWSLFWMSNNTTTRKYIQTLEQAPQHDVTGFKTWIGVFGIGLYCFSRIISGLLYTDQSYPSQDLCVLTGSSERLVDRTEVDPGGWRSAVVLGDQPDDSHLCVEFLGPGFCEPTCLAVPASPFQE